MKRTRFATKFSRSNTLIPAYKRYSTDSDLSEDASYSVASSRHGLLSPRELEPFQCCILFYSSCWSIPHKEARQVKKYGLWKTKYVSYIFSGFSVQI